MKYSPSDGYQEVLDHASQVAPHELGAHAQVARDFVLGAEDELIRILTLQARIDRRRVAAEQARAGRRARVGDEVHRRRVEVVAEAGRLAAERPDVDVHRDALVEAAPVREQLAASVPREVPDDSQSGCPVLGEVDRRLAGAVADLLTLPADARIDREVRGRPPAVLQVERAVVGLRLGHQRDCRLPGRRHVRVVAGRLIVHEEPVAVINDAVRRREPVVDHAAACRVAVDRAVLHLPVGARLQFMAGQELGRVDLEDVARELGILEGAAEAAGADVGRHGLVDGQRRELAGAGVIRLLGVPADDRAQVEGAAETGVVGQRRIHGAGLLLGVPGRLRSGHREDGALTRRRVGIEGPDEPLAAAEAIGQLHGREMPGLIGWNFTAERGRARRRQGADDAGLRRIEDRVVRAEEPEAVPDDVAANVEPDISTAVQVLDRRRGLRPIALGRVVRHQLAALVEGVDRAAEHVAARLRDDVDDAAGHAAVLRRETAGLQFDLVDEVEVELLGALPLLDACRVQTLDDVLVFSAGGPEHRRPDAVLGRPRCDARDRVHVAANREPLEEVRVGVDADRRAGRVDGRRRGADRHRLDEARHLHRQHEIDGAIEANLDVRLFDRLEAGHLDLQLVAPWRHAHEPERAVLIGDLRLGALQRRPCQGHRRAGKHGTLSVFERPHNASRRLRPGYRRRQEERRQDQPRSSFESVHLSSWFSVHG